MMLGLGEDPVAQVAAVPTFTEGVTAWQHPYQGFQSLTGEVMFGRFKTEPMYALGLAVPVLALGYLLLSGKHRR